MDIIYSMPGQSHRIFINVVHACPNACFFCVDFKGDRFFGFDLKNRRPYSADEIIGAVEKYPNRHAISDVYFCGIGEPLLRYDTIMETAKKIRQLFPPHTVLAINTSGTFFLRNPRVDFAKHFDLIQVSLNAENEEKYNAICRPKINGAYRALMAFLHELRTYLDKTKIPCHVELSIVDTSDVESLPVHERLLKNIPKPDFEACRIIAEGFGWPLKVKSLIKNCELEEWQDFSETVRKSINNATMDNI